MPRKAANLLPLVERMTSLFTTPNRPLQRSTSANENISSDAPIN